MVVGFDFDGVLTDETFKNFVAAMSKSLESQEVVVITTRAEADEEVIAAIKELGIKSVMVYAIGDTDYRTKAAFVADEEMKIDLFFDNDPYEVDAFIKLGILCTWIPTRDPESLMAEIYQGFVEEKYKEFFGPAIQQE